LTETNRVIEAVWRIESGRLTAALARMVGDVSLADDLAQDALLAALEQWPKEGLPEKPAAWLMSTAKHRAIDMIRRRNRLDEKHQQLGQVLEIEENSRSDFDEAVEPDQIKDDLLRLMFVACHPVLSME